MCSLAGKRTAFEQYEAQLYEELQTIISETGVLHTALDRTLKLEIETYQKALDPITSTTQRLENLSSVGGSPHGGSLTSTATFGNTPNYTSELPGGAGSTAYSVPAAGPQTGYSGSAIGGQTGYPTQQPGEATCSV